MSTRWDSYKSHCTTLALLVCAAVLVNGGPNPFGGPQFRQRQNLASGICNRPLAISVCLESCMAENAREFGQMGLFASTLVKYFSNVQPNTIKMAINYCSSIQQWVDWTPSTQMFADYVMGMHQLYALNMNNAFGAYGPFGTYGAFSPLQPATGVCLERASPRPACVWRELGIHTVNDVFKKLQEAGYHRLSMAQLPPSYQPLVILLTSGRSSNPMYTIQQAQAAMFAGAEIFAVTEMEPEMSEELKLSVSGPTYLMAVRDMNFLGRPEIDAIITSVCKIERAVKSSLFPVNVIGNLQKSKDQVNIPLLLAQGSDQFTPTTISPRNTTTREINVTSSNFAFSRSDTTELDTSSTVSSSGNSSRSESGEKDTSRQQFSTSGSKPIWQNVTGKTTTLPVSNSSFESLPIKTVGMESFPFGVTQSGASVSIVSDNTTSKPSGSEAVASSSLDLIANQSVRPESENKSFTTPDIEMTSFSSTKPNSTFGFKATAFELLESKNSSLEALESRRQAASLLQSVNTTFGLFTLVADSGDALLEKTTQSVLPTPQNIRSEMFNDNNKTSQKLSAVSQTSPTLSDVFSTATFPVEASSIAKPSSQTSIADESRVGKEHSVTFQSPSFLPISPTVNTRRDMLQLGVLPPNNFPTNNVLGNTTQRDNAFPEQRLPVNALNHDRTDSQNETAGEPPLEFMRDGCAELERTTDPLLRAKMQQERPECSGNKTAPHDTPDVSCIDLNNITNPLVQLDIILTNTPRQPCGNNLTKNSFTSPASPEKAPQMNMSDTVLGRSKGVSSASQETRICIDLNNIFDIYRLGILLANWPNQFVDDNNVSNHLKPAHAESISALGVNGLGKHVSLKQLDVSNPSFFPQTQPFLQTSEAPHTKSTPAIPSSPPALTTNFTTTTDNSALAIKELASNSSLLNRSSSMFSKSASPIKDRVRRALSAPVQPVINISIIEDPLIRQALLSANTTLQPSPKSDSMTPMTNSSTNIFIEEINNNNLKHNAAAISLLPESTPTHSTNNLRIASSLETITIKPPSESVSSANNKTATNLLCVDISSAPANTRRVLTELIKPLYPCPIDTGLDENALDWSPVTSAESEEQNPCPDLAMLPPFIKLIVKIFPFLSPCETRDRIKLTKRDIILYKGNNTSSVSKSVGNIGTASKTPIDHRQASNTTEVPCVDVSILPESDRLLAADFFRMYNILSCDSQKTAHPTADQMERPDSCVNVTMFSGKQLTRITTYFSLYGIRPCLETRNCLEFTLLTPELLSKYIELYGPLALCKTKG